MYLLIYHRWINITTAKTVRYETRTKGEVSIATRTRMGAKPKVVSPIINAAMTFDFEFWPVLIVFYLTNSIHRVYQLNIIFYLLLTIPLKYQSYQNETYSYCFFPQVVPQGS